MSKQLVIKLDSTGMMRIYNMVDIAGTPRENYVGTIWDDGAIIIRNENGDIAYDGIGEENVINPAIHIALKNLLV